MHLAEPAQVVAATEREGAVVHKAASRRKHKDEIGCPAPAATVVDTDETGTRTPCPSAHLKYRSSVLEGVMPTTLSNSTPHTNAVLAIADAAGSSDGP